MSDLGPAVGAFLEVFGPVLGVALRSLVSTALGLAVFCVACATGSAWLAADGSWTRGLVAGGLCLLGGVAVTGVLAVKNGVLGGLLAAVEKVALGGRAVRLIFGQLGVGDETGAVGALVERVPLGDAEARLKAVIERLLAERAAKSGLRAWLARATMAAIFLRVETFTLARFRADASAGGGVDLRLVRDQLGSSIDSLIAGEVRAQLRRLNVLVAGAYAAGAVAVGLLVGHFVAR
jgi:hypothetical protein